MNNMNSSEGPKSGVFMAAKELFSLPIPDEDYGKEFPLDATIPSRCSCCDKKYNNDEFLALPVPKGSEGAWFYPAAEVEFAIRECTCGNRLARRVV